MILNKHYEITKSLGYCKEPKNFYDWWNRPILSPSSDIYENCRFIEDGKFGFDIRVNTILDYILHIEEKTECAGFTVLIDGYWFQNQGNYLNVAKNIFGDNHNLRKFIDELHGKNHTLERKQMRRYYKAEL